MDGQIQRIDFIDERGAFAWRKSEDSPIKRPLSTVHPFHRTRRDRQYRPRSRPSKHALSESAAKFCESRRRQTEFCPALLQQDFVAQRTPAGWHVPCPMG